MAARVTPTLHPVRSWLRGCALLMLAACEATWGAPDAPRCSTVVSRVEIAFSGVSSTDLLLVVSNAPSMVQEQTTLAQELPALMRVLVTGEGPDRPIGEAQRDLHVAVVSTDLGVHVDPFTLAAAPAAIDGCSLSGDGAAFQHAAPREGCAPRPAFLSYRVPRPTEHPLVEPPSTQAAEALVHDVACSAALGSTSCAVAQPLEASLRALWSTEPSSNARFFASRTLGGTPQGVVANAGFLRDDPVAGLSLIYVLLISDGDDCSLRDPGLFARAAQDGTLAPPALCARREDLLHDVQRYAAALRTLRIGNESLVMFGAITGVPQDFVATMPNHDDDQRRNAWYASLLADPRMQNTVREDGTLAPVCESALASATPARRIVQTAQLLGQEGHVVSICAPSWSQVITPLFDTLASHVGLAVCFGRKPLRGPDGLTQCTVTWSLPLPGTAPSGAPTSCTERPFLRDASPLARRADGRALCEVHQLAVTGLPGSPQLEPGEGWFFDDFSGEEVCRCGTGGCNSLFFAPSVPPSGVQVAIECFETRVLDAQPEGADDPTLCRVP